MFYKINLMYGAREMRKKYNKWKKMLQERRAIRDNLVSFLVKRWETELLIAKNWEKDIRAAFTQRETQNTYSETITYKEVLSIQLLPFAGLVTKDYIHSVAKLFVDYEMLKYKQENTRKGPVTKILRKRTFESMPSVNSLHQAPHPVSAPNLPPSTALVTAPPYEISQTIQEEIHPSVYQCVTNLLAKIKKNPLYAEIEGALALEDSILKVHGMTPNWQRYNSTEGTLEDPKYFLQAISTLKIIKELRLKFKGALQPPPE